MLNHRFDMNAEVQLPTGERARVIGVYFYAHSARPQYLTEHKDGGGVLYRRWFDEHDLREL